MAYPYDAPATELTGYWSDGAYTPGDTVAYIKDDVTPINKNAMINSVGRQLSLIQNFVNLTYIGRNANYIDNSYLKTIHTATLFSSGYVSSASPGTIDLYSDLIPIITNSVSFGDSMAKVKSIYVNDLNISSLSGLAGGGAYIQFTTDIFPHVDGTLSIGSVTNKIGTVYASTLKSNVVQTSGFSSIDYVSDINHGDILVHSNLLPGGTTAVNLGDGSADKFGSFYTTDIYLYTTDATYTAVDKLWVDTSGYVRRGDKPNYWG